MASIDADVRDVEFDAFLDWLDAAALQQALASLLSPGQSASPAVLAVDCLAACNHSCGRLGGALVHDTERLRRELMETLHAEGILPTRVPRLWLRLHHVPLPALGVQEVLSGAAGNVGRMLCVVGVVQAVSTASQCAYSRALRCLHCGAVTEVLEGGSSNGDADVVPCCEEQAAAPALEQHLAGRVLVPCQELHLVALTSALGLAAAAGCGGGGGGRRSGNGGGHGGDGGATGRVGGTFHVSRSTLTVTLLDDLAGRVALGDVVQVVGRLRLLAPPLRTQATGPALGEVVLDANNMAPVAPHQMWRSAISGEWLQQQLQGPAMPLWGGGGTAGGTAAPLQALVDTLRCALMGSRVEGPLGVALLLSAVSVPSSVPAATAPGEEEAAGGRQDEWRDGRRGGQHPAQSVATSTGGRKQVSLLLRHGACDPLPLRLLRCAAALLSPHSALLPRPATQSTADLAAPRAERRGGAGRTDLEGRETLLVTASGLLLANRGIAVVDGELLPPRAKAQLVDFLGSPSLPVPVAKVPGQPPLSVPATATVWAAVSEASHPGGGRAAVKGSGGGGGGSRDVELGRGSGFDVVLPWLMDHGNEVADVFAAAGLEGARGECGAGATATATAAAAATAALRDHVALAVGAPPPCISPEARDMLLRYCKVVRSSASASASRVRGVPQAEAVTTLLNLALGCARLLRRPQALPWPHCTVAIWLHELTMASRCGEDYQGLGLPEVGGGTSGGGRTGGTGGTGGASLDQQLWRVHEQVEQHLAACGYAPSVSNRMEE